MGISGIHSLRRPRERREAARVSVAPRSVVAVCAGGLAVLAAAVAAVGPAKGESAQYIWPPPVQAAEAPSKGWYAPLPLLNRVPPSLEVSLPCGLSRPLRSEGPVTVLATARRPRATEALQITQEGRA